MPAAALVMGTNCKHHARLARARLADPEWKVGRRSGEVLRQAVGLPDESTVQAVDKRDTGVEPRVGSSPLPTDMLGESGPTATPSPWRISMGATVRIENVTKRFRVRAREASPWRDFFSRRATRWRTAIDALSLDVAAGEKLLVLGKNGAGKSTLLRLLAGLCAADSGTIRVVSSAEVGGVRRSPGVMLGTELLYPTLTGRQNLELSAALLDLSQPRERAEQAGQRWALGPWLDEPVEEYPTGRRALLALARATLGDPALLLLDEPAAHLDARHRAIFLDYLASSPATILVTHPGLAPLEGPFSRVVTL